MLIASAVLVACGLYLVAGFVFGVMFVWALVSRLDAATRSAPWTFRLCILPGCIALWPMLFALLLRKGRHS
ncbi:MAG: hypothetical protein KF869_10415 [Phycisphaeraceae bacterium]|nr:hypothetical protein [Phycisphaeraceae bacterium]